MLNVTGPDPVNASLATARFDQAPSGKGHVDSGGDHMSNLGMNSRSRIWIGLVAAAVLVIVIALAVLSGGSGGTGGY